MARYDCWEQRKPIGGKEIEVAPGVVVREYSSNLVLIGQVEAVGTEQAIHAARKRFRIRWPLVAKSKETMQ